MAKPKAKTNSLRWVPFDVKTGALAEYAGYNSRRLDLDDPMVRAAQLTHQYYALDWKPNYQFQDTLTFVGFSYGRSAGRARLKDSRGNEYGMYMSEFERILLEGRMTGVTINGNWTFGKRGSNYGIVEA